MTKDTDKRGCFAPLLLPRGECYECLNECSGRWQPTAEQMHEHECALTFQNKKNRRAAVFVQHTSIAAIVHV